MTAIASMLAGCVDDKYDFDNYDGTVQLEVKDLVLPLKLAPVTFESVINIGTQEGIGYDAQGNYVLLKTGRFETENDIEIKTLVASPAQKLFASEEIPVGGIAGMNAAINTESITKFDFEVTYDKVDRYIRGLYAADVNFGITLRVATDFDCTYNTLRFRLPEGMIGQVESSDKYTAEGNIVEFHDITSKDFSFKYNVSEIRLEPKNLQTSDNGYGIFHVKNSIALTDVEVTANETGTGKIQASFEITDIEILTVSGKIMYDFKDFESETALQDLPEVLQDPNTRISLQNPQLYLRVKNPLAQYGDVTAAAGIDVEQIRTSGWLPQSTHIASSAGELRITGTEDDQLFVLAPQKPENFYEDYAGVEWNPEYAVSGLGNIIYGEGLPDALKFTFSKPHVNESTVTKFPLGVKIGKISGDYAFYAPLAFTGDTQVVYTQDQNGWNVGVDEDLEISTLEISAHVDSKLPIDVEFAVNPLEIEEDGSVRPNYDVYIEGNQPGEGVKVKSGESDIVIKLVGDIKHLEGIRYTVKLNGAEAKALNPNQSISFTDLRVKVSGKYLMRDKGDDDYEYEY